MQQMYLKDFKMFLIYLIEFGIMNSKYKYS